MLRIREWAKEVGRPMVEEEAVVAVTGPGVLAPGYARHEHATAACHSNPHRAAILHFSTSIMAAEHDETRSGDCLFEGIRFVIIPTKDFPDEKNRQVRSEAQQCLREAVKLSDYQVKEQLVNFGALYVPLSGDGRIENLNAVSHIITNNADFEQYHEALAKYIHVTKPSWVEDCITRNKQTNPRQFSPDRCLVLNGIVVTCANIPSGDKEAIAGAVVALGGQFSEILTKQITHIVTLGIDNDKCKMAMAKNLSCKIVIPHWYVDLYGYLDLAANRQTGLTIVSA